jgi:hypothetical protein
MHTLSLSHPAPDGRILRRQYRMRMWAQGPASLRLLSCRAGNVAVEFALAAPVLIMLMLASAELARFVILHQKMDRVATTISDLVSRAETINESEMTDILTAAGEVAFPYDLANLGVVIVSSVTNPDGNGAIVAWQRSGGGSYSGTSHLGLEGDDAVLPPDSRCARARPRSSQRCFTTSRRSQRADRRAAGGLSERPSPAASRHPGGDRGGLSARVDPAGRSAHPGSPAADRCAELNSWDRPSNRTVLASFCASLAAFGRLCLGAR